MSKRNKEEWKIMGNVFDQFTNKILVEYIKSQTFDGLESPIKIGKEANIFTATNAKKKSRVIVKIYRLESCNFNTMYFYIKSDPRYIGTRNNRRQIIFNWVQREFKNLKKALKVGVNVPKPLSVKYNVIVMELAKRNGKIAPQLKDCFPEDPVLFFNTVIEEIIKLYHDGKIVHGDLSAFNILVGNKDRPIIIDMSQGTAIDSLNAKELMLRDLKNILTFFKKNFDQFNEENAKKNFKDFELTEESLYKYITRFDFQKPVKKKVAKKSYKEAYEDRLKDK